MSTPTPEQLRHLLLHRLTEEETQRLEEQLMQDEQTADLLHHEETDLVDDYAQGRLAAEDREAFERRLLTDPRIRQRVKVARALHHLTDRRVSGASGETVPSGKLPLLNRWPIRAAAAFVLCVLAVGLVLRATRQADVSKTAMTGPVPSSGLEPGSETGGEPSARIVLLADVGRGGQRQPLPVRAASAPVRLQAEATSRDSSVSYRLSVTDDAGRTVFTSSDLRPRQSGGYVFVEVVIPAGTLGTGLRTVRLEPQRPGVESFTWQLDMQAPAN